MRLSLATFTLLLLALTTPGLAQDFREGYIVTRTLDTLHGQISYRSGRTINECEFKPSKKAPVVKYTGDDLASFEVDYTVYHSVKLASDTLNAGTVFMSVLALGEIDLYKFHRFFFLLREGELIGLPEPLLVSVDRPGVLDGSKYMQKDSRYVVILNQIVSECSINANETEYNERDMIQLISAFNSCNGNSEKLSEMTRLRVNFQAFVSYGTSSMDLSYKGKYALADLHVPFTRDWMFSGGGSIDLSIPRLTDRLFVTAELWYGKYAFQGHFETRYLGGNLSQEHSITLTSLKIPIGLRYDFVGGQANTPYVKGGLEINHVIKSEYKTYDTIVYPWGGDDYHDVNNQNDDVKKNPFRFWIGTGYVIRLSGFRLFVELRGEYGGGFVGDSLDSKSAFAELNLLTGIRF